MHTKYLERRLADDIELESCEDKMEDRLKGIKDDIKIKYRKFSPRRFQRSYPITKNMRKGTTKDPANYNDNYKTKTDFKDDWRKDWHSALIHYIECNDFDLFNPISMRDDKKLSKKARDNKKDCKEKVTVHNSIKKYIQDNIPYPAFTFRKKVDPEESEDDKENDNTKRNANLQECLENDV